MKLKMKRTVVLTLALGSLSMVAAPGCTRYFRVRDPASGNEYYTNKMSRTRTGAVRFRELSERAEITLQSSEVKQVRKQDVPPELLEE